MRKTLKLVFTTVAASMLFVTPVFATEQDLTKELLYINNHVKEVSTQISNYMTSDDGCDLLAKQDHVNHKNEVEKQLNDWVKAEQANYIDYLQKVVNNKKEVERIKRENVNALAALLVTNPTLQSQYNAALNEYNNAVNDKTAAELAIGQAKQIFAQNNVMTNAFIQNVRQIAMAKDK